MRKNPHAVALGRRGGKKGGRARMDAMTAAERRAFARKGGVARQATLRAERQELLNKMHDGRWMMERLKPLKRLEVATEQARSHYEFLRSIGLPSYRERLLHEWVRMRST